MSILDDLATWNDFPKALQQVVPSEDRNFQMPKEPFWQSTAPVDNNMAEDNSSELVKQVQTFLKSAPLGVSYSGPITGKFDNNLLNTLLSLETKIKQQYPSENIILIFNNKILSSGISKLQKLLSNSKKENIQEKKPQISSEENAPEKVSLNNQQDIIKDFQKMFNLPITGTVDPKLISAVKSAENEIAKAINDSSVKGMIWDDFKKMFKTTSNDLQSALKLIKK